MNSELLKGLNEHLKLEFRAAHEYLAMSVWLSANDLPGFSKWMRQQSSDELTHAQRIIDHLLERDQQPVLPAIPAPPKSWKSIEALCLHVLKNEQEVTASINELYAAAENPRTVPPSSCCSGSSASRWKKRPTPAPCSAGSGWRATRASAC